MATSTRRRLPLRIPLAVLAAGSLLVPAARELLHTSAQALSGARRWTIPCAALALLGATASGAGIAEGRRRKRTRNAGAPDPDEHRVLQAIEVIARAASSDSSLDQVFAIILHHSRQIIGASDCALTLVDENGRLRVRHSAGSSEALLSALEDPDGDPCARRAFIEGRAATLGATACAPMILNGSVIGGLHVCGAEGRRFTDEEVGALAAFAAQAGVAVHNARLREEARRSTHDVRISFRRIGAALASGLNLDDTLALIAELACEMLHADACLIRLLDRASGELLPRASHGLAVEEASRPGLAVGEGLSGRVAHTGCPLAVPDLTQDPRSLAFPIGVRAYLGVPLRAKAQVFGVLSVFKRAAYHFLPGEVDLLASFGAQASVAIENRRLWEQERRVAHTLQRSLLPDIPPVIEGMELGELYQPSLREADVGGDFYDLFPLDHGRVGVVMGDVCGKGIRAAIYTAMAKYAVRSYAFDDPAPADVLRRANRALCRQITEDGMFVSMVYALIDARSARLSLANAGHPPPLHFSRASGTAALIACEGTLAGLMPHARYTETCVSLSPGDIVFFYTDGIVEARHEREVWGSESLARSLERHARLPAPALVRAVAEDAGRFADGAPRDDIAALAVKFA